MRACRGVLRKSEGWQNVRGRRIGQPRYKVPQHISQHRIYGCGRTGEKCKVRFTGKECAALTAKAKSGGEQFVIAKPQTFMNLSGESVKQLVRKYCDDENQLIVVYDDADLPVGRMRLREEGSAGTHNGMRSIVKELNTTVFKRLRIGIKTEELAEKEVQIVDLVLSKVDYADKQQIDKCIETAVDAICELVAGADIQRVEEKLNRRK